MTEAKTTVIIEEPKSKMMDRSALLGQEDMVIEKVDLLPPYKGHIYMKSLTGTEWDEYQEQILVEDKKGHRKLNLKKSKAKLIVLASCDEKGTAIFTDKDIPALMEKSNKFLEHLVKVAQRLNGMGDDDSEKN